MKDILDKVKKMYEEKMKPLLGKAKPAWEKVVAFAKEQKRYLGVAGLFIIMVVVLYFFTGSEFNADRIAKLNSKEVSGEDYVPDAAFKVDAYPEVNDLINRYFKAYVGADFATLETLVTPLSEMEKSYITAMSQFYEEYRNVKCYTKQGLSKNSYIVSTCFDIKFKDQEVTAPSMVLFYVQTNKDGSLYINNLYSDFNMQYSELAISKDVYTALRKYTTQDDYLELYNQVESAFSKLIKENNAIYQLTKRTIPGTRQIWEDTVYYAESTEELEGTEGTESTEVTENTTTESQSEEQTTTPEPEPEPVVEKVKIKATVNVRVRSGAGTNFTKIGEVHDGEVYVKLGEETDSSGRKWIKIQYTASQVGYVIAENAVPVTE